MTEGGFPNFAQRHGGINAEALRGISADLSQASARVIAMTQQLADNEVSSQAFIDELEKCQRHIDASTALMLDLLQPRSTEADAPDREGWETDL